TSAPAVQARIDQAVANTRALIERNIDNAADAARANALLDKIIRDTQKLQRIEARIGSSAAGEAATAARQAERVRDGIAAARDELNGLL
ncbi:MAG: hypothetical protein KC416_17745, partial [Myxococcales bacterium]|nr:hypothetical protein [Myxococcales bacterium]